MGGEHKPKHHWPPDQCYYCGKPATAWCDGVNHYLVDGKMKILTKDPDVVGWCERPLCDDHATIVGMSTASGDVDTIDYCPKHLTMKKLGKEPEYIYKHND